MVDIPRRSFLAQNGSQDRYAIGAIWFCIFSLATGISLIVQAHAAGAEFLWLVNALALARVLTLHHTEKPGDMLAMLGLAVAAAQILSGTAPQIAVALGLVQMLEVGAATLLYRRVLRQGLTHDEEGAYLRFLALVVIPAAALSAAAGGLLISIASDDLGIGRAALNWLIGNALGLAGFFPLAMWVLSPAARRYPFTRREMQWTVAAVTITLTVLGVAIIVGEEIKGILTTILLASLFAMRMGRVGAMILSSFLVPTLSLTGIIEPQALIEQDIGLQTELFNLATVFTCLVLPANLIASMISRLQQAERTQRDIAAMKVEFLSTMSHEIKTPMNAIHGMFELFSRSELTDRQRRWADAGLSASRNLQAQVSQILEMARLEENTIKVKIRPVDPRKLLENWIIAAEAGIVAAGKELEVAGAVADTVPDRVMIDEGRVQQILINLLTNAVKFSVEGQILIQIRSVRGALVIEVSDTGIGIAPEDQGLVFERFVQIDRGASRRRDGTGLGLAISRELAMLMGGSLTLRSTLAIGSTFRLTLPLIDVPADRSATS